MRRRPISVDRDPRFQIWALRAGMERAIERLQRKGGRADALQALRLAFPYAQQLEQLITKPADEAEL